MHLHKMTSCTWSWNTLKGAIFFTIKTQGLSFRNLKGSNIFIRLLKPWSFCTLKILFTGTLRYNTSYLAWKPSSWYWIQYKAMWFWMGDPKSFHEKNNFLWNLRIYGALNVVLKLIWWENRYLGPWYPTLWDVTWSSPL